MPDDAEVDLEALFQLLSDEEARELRDQAAARVARARINVGSAVPRDALGDVAYEVVAKIAVMILEGTIPIRTAGQAKDVAGIFHQIARLETGKSTSNAIGDLPRAEREAIVADLAKSAAERAEAREAGLRVVRDDTG